MNENDVEEFQECMRALFASFGQEATKARLMGYWLGLNDISVAAVQTAVALAIREDSRLPCPAELRTKVQGKAEDRALMAWSDCQKAMPLGSYKHIDFEDRLINATVRSLGGWPGMLSRITDSEAEKWVRMEFIKTYKTFASSGVNGDACEPLPGLSEVTVAGGVLYAPVPQRISCDESRRKIPKLLSHPRPQLAIEQSAAAS